MKAAAKLAAARPPKPPRPSKRARRPTNQLSLPGLGGGDATATQAGSAAATPAGDDTVDADDASPAPPTPSSRSRTRRIARAAAARGLNAPAAVPVTPVEPPAPPVDPAAPVTLGTITVPSGNLALFDIALIGYLPRAALDPLMIQVAVPADRPLPVVGTRVGSGRFADCWHHVTIELAPGQPTHRRKLGEAAVDFARLLCIDLDAVDHWQHEDSLDALADFVFWGRDELALAKAMTARRLATPEAHHGWADLPVAEAEAKADRADQLKREHSWQLSAELRPHSHHFLALAAARTSGFGAGMVDVASSRGLLFFTSWGNGLYPVSLELDADDRPVAIRIQLAPPDAPSPTLHRP